MKYLFRLNHFLYRYRWRLMFGILFTGIANYLRVLQPGMVREAIDLVFRDLSFYKMASGFELQSIILREVGRSLMFFSVIIISLAIMMGVFMYFMRQTIIVMSRLIEYDMRKQIYAHLQLLDQSFYRQSATGDLMSRISEDVSKVRMYLGPAIMYSINLMFLVSMVIYFMFRVNVRLSFYTLLPLPILSISIFLVSSMIHKRSFDIQVQLSKLNSIAQEVYSGIKLIKSYVQERSMQNYFDQESEAFRQKSLDLARINAFFYPLMLVLIGVGTILVIYIGGMEVISGDLSPGNVAEFIIYLNMLTWPVTSIGWVASIIQQAAASQKRINALLDTEPQIKNPTQVSPRVIRGDLRFADVRFVYPDTGIQALDGVNFELLAGQKMLILGKTASGKTTIADLILRMYDVTSGQILLDGRPVSEYNLSDLRSQISYVPQDVFLFSDTVEANISFTNPEMDLVQIEHMARRSAIHHDIKKLPNGYQTVVGERGVTLSGGQKQRISIARALAAEPQMIILDDCLSAIDAQTEELILLSLRDELKDKTTILITHRIPGILNFDLILFLDEGQVVERGTHDQLIKKNGPYARLFYKQKAQEFDN